MAIPGDAVGEMRAIVLSLTAVASTLLGGESLSQERRQELAALLEPVISTFEGAIQSEVARREAERQAPAPEAAP